MTDNHLSPLSPEEERLLERFFADRRQAIADRSFSREVARKLPRRAVWIDRLWTALCLAAIAAVVLSRDALAELLSPVAAFLFRAGVWLKTLPELSITPREFYLGYVGLAAALFLLLACVAGAERR